jgi:hypothetical protein
LGRNDYRGFTVESSGMTVATGLSFIALTSLHRAFALDLFIKKESLSNQRSLMRGDAFAVTFSSKQRGRTDPGMARF